MASRPVPERRRRGAAEAPVAGAAGASVAGAEALLSVPAAFTPIRSVVSLTKGSFPGAGVGLSGSATGCAVRLRSAVRTGPGRWSAAVRRKNQCIDADVKESVKIKTHRFTHVAHADSGACSNLLRQSGRLPEEKRSLIGTQSTEPMWLRVQT
ncbi:hypothetical protein GCM10020221_02150 [Streptomyces thioluteus]|uniref:Uncharacterized protein n=1 Tax=Streptomyces thioluteus TaxID=66431 RepID=A0ABN3WB06_STRTU